jgi:hypothetical protein
MRAWITAALCVLLLGCAKKEEAAPDPNTGVPIEVPEIKRGEEACSAWRERACRCATSDPRFQAVCDEAGKIPDAMKMSIQAANSEGLEAETRARLIFEARRIMARCLEEQGKLDPSLCPINP